MNPMKKGLSIRWKLMLLYFLMVFVATTVIGVFLVNQTENYFVESQKSDMESIISEGSLLSSLDSYDELANYKEQIQSDVDAWVKSVQMDIFVVDKNFKVIATNTENTDKNAIDILDRNLLVQGLSGINGESTGELVSNEDVISIMNMVFPIGDDEIKGVLYLRANMEAVNDAITQSKINFLKSLGIALLIALILGFIVAGSISGPIKEMTVNAASMAKGDFKKKLNSKSDDEIGQLADTLNYLRTELNNTIHSLESEREKLETIIRYMEDGLIALDLKGKILLANPAASSILNASLEVLGNGTYEEFVKPLKEDWTFDALLERSKEGPVAENFSNSGFSYALRYTRFKDNAGNDAGIIMIIQDITERLKLENMQMDFVANVSHELKTPLTTIKGYTETLLDGAISDEEMARNFLGIVNDETDRMSRMVKELLQLSRLEYKQAEFSKKEMNIIPLIQTTITKLEISAKQKNQHVNSLFDENAEIRVLVDKDAFEQVIQNIVSNAIKYTPEGGRIDCDALIQGKTAKIVVTDTGIGIPEKEISRVFERFFRVDKARSRAIGGTGLGLSITKQIVEELGGTIEISSTEGVGTRVEILLPLSVKRGKKLDD